MTAPLSEASLLLQSCLVDIQSLLQMQQQSNQWHLLMPFVRLLQV